VRGLLVACEGIDGSGKSTVSRRLVEALAAQGVPARWTCEPTETWLGESVRRALKDDEASPFTDALLFMADHATHVRRVEAWLAAGQVVVSDRWSESTFAYQGAALAREGFDALAWLRAAEAPFDRRPDVVLLFDLPVDAALARLAGRSRDAEKFERREFLERVRANYAHLAAEDPSRYVVLDAARDAEAVAREALAAVLARR